MPSYTEVDIRNAIAAYRRGDYASISRTAANFKIPFSTLRCRLLGRGTRHQSHEKQQLLSTTEEEELVSWITNVTGLARDMPEVLLHVVRQVSRERLHLRIPS